jgi:hypothetical protein
VFNVVGELKGVISDQGQFVSIDDLSEKKKLYAFSFLFIVKTKIVRFVQCFRCY